MLLFFRQKTAYEMRISDWSSDVCSSDLYFPLSPAVGAVLYLSGGNPELKPERATNWTTTVTITPSVMKRLRIDASYFHIIYRNRVVTPIPSNYSVAFNPIYRDRKSTRLNSSH